MCPGSKDPKGRQCYVMHIFLPLFQFLRLISRTVCQNTQRVPLYNIFQIHSTVLCFSVSTMYHLRVVKITVNKYTLCMLHLCFMILEVGIEYLFACLSCLICAKKQWTLKPFLLVVLCLQVSLSERKCM